MKFVFDTNILLHYIRENEVFRAVENVYSPFAGSHDIFISVVSIGEIKSIARQNNWGEKKLVKMLSMISKLIIAEYRSMICSLLWKN
jgi:predicted nucleic acid-binding protein